MINYSFNPFDMATHGLLSNNSFTIAVQGHLTIIEIDEVKPSIKTKLGGAFLSREERRKKLYKITVKIFVDDKVYLETKTVRSQNEPKISDIDVKLSEKNKISISVKKD